MLYRLLSLPLLIVLFSLKCFAQKKSDAVSVQLTGIDFFGPQTGHFFLHKNNNQNPKLYWDPALQVTFFKSLTPKLDLTTSLTFSGLYMPLSKKDSNYFLQKESSNTATAKMNLPFIAFDAGFRYSFMKAQESLVNPFAKAGIGYYAQSAGSGVSSYVGLGFDVKLMSLLFLTLQSDFHYSISSQYQSRLQHAAGFKYYFRNPTEGSPKIRFAQKSKKSNSKVKEVISAISPVKPMMRDSDGDGISDEGDRCPTHPGKKDLNGCPDSDGDQIADHKDQCPDKPGPIKMNGCPDRDGDELSDDKDACPDIKGLINLNGCPDSDTDGIADMLDKCPEKFAKTVDGCPVEEIKPIVSPTNEEVQVRQKEAAQKVREAAKQILFQPNSYIIDSSVVFALDSIASVLKADSMLMLDIEGHTDSSGNAEKNLQLSQQRADACKEYLVKQGIDENRISSVGYGDMNPIADNRTPEGRSANRRTDFLLHLPERE